mgnify:CR=1 FL=1
MKSVFLVALLAVLAVAIALPSATLSAPTPTAQDTGSTTIGLSTADAKNTTTSTMAANATTTATTTVAHSLAIPAWRCKHSVRRAALKPM